MNHPRPSEPEPPPPVIRASELAQYSFCHKAWWLATVQQVSPQSQRRLARGRDWHAQLEQSVVRAGLWQRLGSGLMVVGGLGLIAALLWFWLVG